MESFLRRIAIIFILCMLAVILIFLGINYKSDKEAKNIRKNNAQEIKKVEEKDNKSTSQKSKDKKKSDASSKKNNKNTEENNNLYTNTTNSDVNNSNTTNTDSDNNYYDNSFISVTKFSARINNNRLYIGDTASISTTIYPEDATIQDVIYSSSNKNIAIVSSTGIVTGVNVGECYITVSVRKAGSGQIKVHVLPSNNTTYEYSTSSQNEITNNQSNDESNKEEIIYAQPTTPSTNENTNPDTKEEVIDAKPTTPTADTTLDNNNTNNDTNTNNVNVEEPKTNKNGWTTEDGKKYYYKDNQKLKDTYVDYIYLDNNGVAQDKIGSFSATLYGATAWANQKLNIRKRANNSSAVIGTIPVGGKMKILSSEDSSTKYIKVKYNGKEGYVYSDYIYINLPDVIPDVIYEISNANKAISKSAGKSIPGVTGKNLYGFNKKYNEKIGKTTYYAPLLYPVAKQFQKAYNKAVKEGYNLKVYDSYRPRSVTQYTNTKFRELYNSDSKVKKAVDYDKDGAYWGPGWFLAQSVSRHNRGVALDLTLTNKNGKELPAQTPMDTLDARSVRKYNNSNAKNLSSIMTSAGFETLDSEWWHFQEDSYKNSPYTTFKVR